MEKLAHIWTNQDVYIFSFLSFSQLNNIPAINNPTTRSINKRGVNQSSINATWYNAKALELNIYAKFLLETFFRFKKANPRKKNSSSSEFINEIYKATKIKLPLFTPILFCNEEVTLERLKYGLSIK